MLVGFYHLMSDEIIKYLRKLNEILKEFKEVLLTIKDTTKIMFEMSFYISIIFLTFNDNIRFIKFYVGILYEQCKKIII
jgi:hypothetical protein